jgi:hypothetical protein
MILLKDYEHLFCADFMDQGLNELTPYIQPFATVTLNCESLHTNRFCMKYTRRSNRLAHKDPDTGIRTHSEVNIIHPETYSLALGDIKFRDDSSLQVKKNYVHEFASAGSTETHGRWTRAVKG